jgi:hypothetical protein
MDTVFPNERFRLREQAAWAPERALTAGRFEA